MSLFSDELTRRLQNTPADIAIAANLRLEAVKTGLTVAAGLGAGATLLLALRRQTTTERAQRVAEEDAEEDRITTLYVAAAEQIGSEKAAVRLAGLYALERLGQNHSRLRQTVFDVICAYLRMPYKPPEDIAGGDVATAYEQMGFRDDATAEGSGRREFEVRRTAQDILVKHLRLTLERTEAESFWRNETGELLHLDLAYASLYDFDLTRCLIGSIRLDRANIHGELRLNELHILGPARFAGMRTWGATSISSSTFSNLADFNGTNFQSLNVNGVRFKAALNLTGTQFAHDASFHDVEIQGILSTKAQFRTDAAFSDIVITGPALLRTFQVHGTLSLRNVKFESHLSLDNPMILGPARVTDLRVRELNLIPSQNGTPILLRQSVDEEGFNHILPCRQASAPFSEKVPTE